MPGTTLKQRLQRSATFFENKDGGTAIVMGILAPVLLFGIAFGSEVAGWEMTKRRIQNASDVAAFAAAKQLAAGYSADIQFKAANYIATQSGFSGGDQKITVANPPTTAPDVKDPDSNGTISPNGDDQYIHVILEQPVRRNFSRMFVNVFGSGGSDEVIIRSEAIAYLDNGNAGTACVLSLSPNRDNAVSVQGSTTVTLSGCQVAANSSHNQAFVQQGNGQISADCIQVAGDVSIGKTENVNLAECNSARTGASAVADPYAAVPEPTYVGNCPNGSSKIDDAENYGPASADGKVYLKPGCYQGGKTFSNEDYVLDTGVWSTLNVTGNGNNRVATWVDAPLAGPSNVFVFDGGNWRVNGNASLLAEGVTIYLKNGASFSLNGGGNITLEAPDSGTYAGLAIFISRNQTSLSKWNGGSDFVIRGALYAPTSELEFSGNTQGSDPNECLQVIGLTVKMTGNSNFNTECDSYGTKPIEVEGGTDSISIVG